jgi:multimeric flavodoxin WrbA
MKKVLAINASPRKKWNTAMALQSALEGAASAGAETKLIHLAGLKFTGCISWSWVWVLCPLWVTPLLLAAIILILLAVTGLAKHR